MRLLAREQAPNGAPGALGQFPGQGAALACLEGFHHAALFQPAQRANDRPRQAVVGLGGLVPSFDLSDAPDDLGGLQARAMLAQHVEDQAVAFAGLEEFESAHGRAALTDDADGPQVDFRREQLEGGVEVLEVMPDPLYLPLMKLDHAGKLGMLGDQGVDDRGTGITGFWHDAPVQ